MAKNFKLLEDFNNYYHSPEFKRLKPEEQLQKRDEIFNAVIEPVIVKKAKNERIYNSYRDRLYTAWENKFPTVQENLGDTLGRQARVAIGGVGAGATELFSDVATLGRKAAGIPQPEKTIGEKFKEALPGRPAGVTPGQEEAIEPGLAFGSRLAGNVLTPLPILGQAGAAIKAFKGAKTLGAAAKGAAKGFGTPLLGPELATGEKIFEAGAKGVKVKKTQTAAEVIESSINPAVNPRGVKQLLGQVGTFTGVHSAAEQIREKGEIDFAKITGDETKALLIGGVGIAGVKVISGLLRNIAKGSVKQLSEQVSDAGKNLKTGSKEYEEAQQLITDVAQKGKKKAVQLTDEEVKQVNDMSDSLDAIDKNSEIPKETFGFNTSSIAHLLYGDPAAVKLFKLNPLTNAYGEFDTAVINGFINKGNIDVIQNLNKNLNTEELDRFINTSKTVQEGLKKQSLDQLMDNEVNQLKQLTQEGEETAKRISAVEKDISGIQARKRELAIIKAKESGLAVPKHLDPTAIIEKEFVKQYGEFTNISNVLKGIDTQSQKYVDDLGKVEKNKYELDVPNTKSKDERTVLEKLLSDEEGSMSTEWLEKGIVGFSKVIREGFEGPLKVIGELTRQRQPLDLLTKLKAPKVLVNAIKLSYIESKRYIHEVESKYLNALAILKLHPSDYPQIAAMLETTPVETIIASEAKDPLTLKAKVIANFFRDSAKIAGLPEEQFLDAYFPHIGELDPEAAEHLSDWVKKGSAFFMKERAAGSTLQSVDILQVMKAYGAGTRRQIMRRSQGVLEAQRKLLPASNELGKVYDLILHNMTRVYRHSSWETARVNTIQNYLRGNVSSSILNATQTLTTLVPEIGIKAYVDVWKLLKEKPVIDFIKKLGLEDDILAKYDVYSDSLGIDKMQRLSDLPSVSFLKYIDLFSNVEQRNRIIAATAGALRQAGGKEQLLGRLRRGMSRSEENELLVAAQDMVERTQFAPNPLNRTKQQNEEWTKALLMFHTTQLGEAGLVTGWINKILDPATRTQGITSLVYYLGVKTLLSGKAGATVLVPSAVWYTWREMHPESYRAVQDSLQILDVANIPGYFGLDYSQNTGLIDPTDRATYDLSQKPLPRALGSAIGSVFNLGKTVKDVAGGKKIDADLARDTVRDITNIVVPTKTIPTLKLPGKGLELGIGASQISKAVKAGINVQSGTNKIGGIERPTNLGKEALRQIAPLKEDVPRFATEKARLQDESKSFKLKGLRPPKETTSKLEKLGKSDVESTKNLIENQKSNLIELVATGNEKQRSQALRILRGYYSTAEIQDALRSRIKPKGKKKVDVSKAQKFNQGLR